MNPEPYKYAHTDKALHKGQIFKQKAIYKT